MAALASVVPLPRVSDTHGIRLRKVTGWVPPDPRPREGWVASFGLPLVGYRKTIGPVVEALGALGATLAEWVANARDGLALQLRLARRGEQLAVHWVASVRETDPAEAENRGAARRDELVQLLRASPAVSTGEPATENTLAAWTEPGRFCAASVAIPMGPGTMPLSAEALDPAAMARLVDLLLAQDGDAMVLVSMRRAPAERAVQLLGERVSGWLADTRQRAMGARFTSAHGVTVQRLPADLTRVIGAQALLEREAAWLARIAHVALEMQVAVLGERRAGAPLLQAVGHALVPSIDMGWEHQGRHAVLALLAGPETALDELAAVPGVMESPGAPSPAALIAARHVPIDVAARLVTLPVPGPDGLPGVPLDPLVSRSVPNAILRDRPGAARLAEAPRRQGACDVRIATADLARHVYVSGKTGVGKSTLVKTLLLDLARQGRGVGVIDPHGDLADEVIAAIRVHRPVVVFDPSDPACPGLNPIWTDGTEVGAERAVEDLAGIMFSLYPGDYMGPMFDRHSRSLLFPLLAAGHGLGEMSRLANDAVFRRAVLQSLNPNNTIHAEIKMFWEKEFANWGEQLKGEMVSYTVSKYDALVKSSALRRVTDPLRPQLDIRRVLDEGGVLVARLPESALGQVSAWFLGMLLLQRLRAAAFSRGSLPPSQRRPFCLAIDEFQKFVGDGGFGYAKTTRTLAPMLDECRKFGVALVLANQYAAQLDERTRDAVFGNVGSMVCFRSGADDAAVLANELGHGTSAEELRGLPLFHALARLLVDGQATPVFTLRTVNPT